MSLSDASDLQPEPARDQTRGPAPGSDAHWAVPGRHGSPAEALARIGVLCASTPELFAAALAVLGTHQAVSREILAVALKQFRPELNDLSRDDVVALLIALVNGGRPGFDAVLRSRRRGERKVTALPFVRE